MELLPYIANVLSRFNNLKETSDGWVVGCPCPNHGGKGEDRNPSVRITIGDEGKILIICRVGCDVNEILQYAGLEYRDLYPNNDNERLEVLARPRKQLSVEEANERHEFYSKLLDQLELEDAHKEHLLERGFTEEDILCGGYKSLRASTFLDACRTLIPVFSP
jgi:putative DNA primase/helicase